MAIQLNYEVVANGLLLAAFMWGDDAWEYAALKNADTIIRYNLVNGRKATLAMVDLPSADELYLAILDNGVQS